MSPKPRRSNRRTVAIAAIFAAVFAGSGAIQRTSGASPAPPSRPQRAPLPLPNESPVSRQLREDVLEAVRANASARSYLEWREGGYTPEDIVRNARELRSAEVPEALCRALAALSDEQLPLFDGQIEDSRDADVIPCSPELAARLERYWQRSRALLDHRRVMERLIRQPGAPEEAGPLPSIDVPIDLAPAQMIYRGGLPNGQIAITLDDGPHPTRTQRMLAILRGAGVRSNFFEIGRNAAQWPDISRQVESEGHVVGSHTWDHPQLSRLPLENAEDDIARGRQEIEAALGGTIPFFRFPYGDHSQPLDEYCRSQGLTMFFWNMDSQDWKIHDPGALLDNVRKELDREKGGVILFHDIHEQTVLVMPHVIDELRARGFSTVLFTPRRN